MQYMLSLIDEEPNWEDISPEEMQANIDQMEKLNDEMAEAGVLVTAAGLRELASATTVSFGEGGETVVSDGPFAETKEQLMGFWVIECASLDEALEWTKKVPMEQGHIEVRPLVAPLGTRGKDLGGGEGLLERVRGGAEAS
jgi:hypothetical protein